ncbi:MAG: hypothetical protein P1S60_14925, partial [Anaerolineae bacterium]|nr:hypothetical protein [Anaerolineae bacterium]
MMSEVESSEKGWGIAVHAANCPVCDWSFLVRDRRNDEAVLLCPHCFRGQLNAIELDPSRWNPELIITPTVTNATINNGIQSFADKIPFPPGDLQSGYLYLRMQLLYLPMWLVDCSVNSAWDAETGVNYEVVSHQEYLAEGVWRTREVKEKRVRWESRVGRLERSYQNVPVPALQGHGEIWKGLGASPMHTAKSYKPDLFSEGWMCLPD